MSWGKLIGDWKVLFTFMTLVTLLGQMMTPRLCYFILILPPPHSFSNRSDIFILCTVYKMCRMKRMMEELFSDPIEEVLHVLMDILRLNWNFWGMRQKWYIPTLKKMIELYLKVQYQSNIRWRYVPIILHTFNTTPYKTTPITGLK